jgi:hypothetical protein
MIGSNRIKRIAAIDASAKPKLITEKAEEKSLINNRMKSKVNEI